MTSRWIAVGVVTTVGAIFLLAAGAGEARPDYTRRTKKECLYCHPADSFRLTDAGEYYRQHRTLDGYQPKEKAEAERDDGPIALLMHEAWIGTPGQKARRSVSTRPADTVCWRHGIIRGRQAHQERLTI